MAMDIDQLKESILKKTYRTDHGNIQQSWQKVSEILNYTKARKLQETGKSKLIIDSLS